MLRAQSSSGQKKEILELIPREKLWDDLPPALVHEHAHWLNLSTKVMEIRPFEQLWETSPENWRIDCSFDQYYLYRGHETLLDIYSPTWTMVSKCFECLNGVEDPVAGLTLLEESYLRARQVKNVLITTSPINTQSEPVQPQSALRLSVTLPRYDLSFFVNDREELESCDFEGMVCDENQCVKALFGLENLLVLRPKTHHAGAEALIPRCVIIPNGDLRKRDDHQVWVDVQKIYPEFGVPSFHTYRVDTELGCLMGDGSMESTRYLIDLHSFTSCHRPDPLTAKTGAQAALSLLQSTRCRPVMKHDASYLEMLHTNYPQINAAYTQIKNRYYWTTFHSGIYQADSAADRTRAAQRAVYLFPSSATGPTPLEGHSHIESAHLTKETTRPRLSIHPCWHPPTLDQLLFNPPAPGLQARSNLLRKSCSTPSEDVSALDQLFSSIQPTVTPFRREYVANLAASAQSVRAQPRITYGVAGENVIEALKKHFMQCRVKYWDSLDILKGSLGPTTDPSEQRLERSGQWPPVAANILLRYLASTSLIDIPPRWKKCLTTLALLLLDLQRARRLLQYTLDGLEEEFLKELKNEVCDGWNPEEYPDWLLIQVGTFCPNARMAVYRCGSGLLSDTRKLSDPSSSG